MQHGAYDATCNVSRGRTNIIGIYSKRWRAAVRGAAVRRCGDAAVRRCGGAACGGAACSCERADAHGLQQKRQQTRMLRIVEEAPEAPARPPAASSALLLRPQHRLGPEDVRDVERAARGNLMMIEFLSVYSPFNLI